MKALNFTPGKFVKPEDLLRQVDALAREVDVAFHRLPAIFMQVLTPVRPLTATYFAALGELVFVDSAKEARIVVLPRAPSGRTSTIGIVGFDVNTTSVTLRAVDGNVNGGPDFMLSTSNRLSLFVSDGTDWWGNSS